MVLKGCHIVGVGPLQGRFKGLLCSKDLGFTRQVGAVGSHGFTRQ